MAAVEVAMQPFAEEHQPRGYPMGRRDCLTTMKMGTQKTYWVLQCVDDEMARKSRHTVQVINEGYQLVPAGESRVSKEDQGLCSL